MSVAPESGRNRIMIYGPKSDGTYIIEFRMSDGESLAISVPARTVRPASTPAGSLKAPSLPIFQFSSRPRSNWSLTSRPPKHSPSKSPRRCSREPTR